MTPESEAQTRRKRIDPLLKKLGWEIVPYDAALDLRTLQCPAVIEHPMWSGPSDYVLFAKDKPLGALEAKCLAVGSEGVLIHAQRYSRDIVEGISNWDGYIMAKGYVDRLTWSILARAFQGELLPQDISDEPDGVLLTGLITQPVDATLPKRRGRPNETGD